MSATLDLYKIFLCIVSCGSLSKASQELFVTQSAISQSLKKLESSMGVVLFERKKQGLVLTEQGKEFLEIIKKPMLELDVAEEKMKYKLKNKRVITICAPNSLAKHYVCNFVGDLKEYDIRILNHYASKDSIAMVVNNDCDFALMKNYVKTKDENIEVIEVGELNYVFFYNPKFVDKSKIFDYQIVIKDFGSRYRKAGLVDFENVVKKFSKKVQVGHDELIIDIVKNFACVGFAPKEYLDDQFEQLEFGIMFNVELQMIYKKDNKNAKKYLEFINGNFNG